MRFSEFRRHSPPGGNVYIFICEDEFLIDESRGVWAGVFGGDWDFSKVSVREFEALEASELLVLARTPPLFGPPRALLVTNAGKITKKKIAVLEELAGLEESFLKVIVSAPTRRSVSALAKTFPKVEIDPPRAGEAARWLRDRYGVTPGSCQLCRRQHRDGTATASSGNGKTPDLCPGGPSHRDQGRR